MRGHLSHYVKNWRAFESFRESRRAFQSFAVKKIWATIHCELLVLIDLTQI
jgi:hypothetical protein